MPFCAQPITKDDDTLDPIVAIDGNPNGSFSPPPPPPPPPLASHRPEQIRLDAPAKDELAKAMDRLKVAAEDVSQRLLLATQAPAPQPKILDEIFADNEMICAGLVVILSRKGLDIDPDILEWAIGIVNRGGVHDPLALLRRWYVPGPNEAAYVR